MSEFIRPQVSVEEVNENLARVSAEPLERGYGDTLGNSLRRVLLSSLEGAAVQAIQIDGVQHEFTTVPGVYVAGDMTGVEEASTAMEEGKLAGIAAACSLGYLTPEQA